MNSTVVSPVELPSNNDFSWLEQAVLEDEQKGKYDENIASTWAGDCQLSTPSPPPPPPPPTVIENPTSNAKRKRSEKVKKIETKSILKSSKSPSSPSTSSSSYDSEGPQKLDESSPSNFSGTVQSQTEVNNLLLRKCLNLKRCVGDLRDRFISLSNTMKHKQRLRKKIKERRAAAKAKRQQLRQKRPQRQSKTPASKSKGVRQQVPPPKFPWENPPTEEEDDMVEEEEEEGEEGRNYERTTFIFY